MQEKVGVVIRNWQKRNIDGIFCANKDQVHSTILDMIPEKATIGFCGSQTLEQMEIIEMLESRGNKIFNQYDSGLSRDESMKVRKLGAQADFFLGSANAISEKGEMVFFSAYGHRTAGIADANRVILVCGVNKITSNLEEALKRARNYVTPLNCRRLRWDTPCVKDGICHNDQCLAPDYNRMCCQVLIIESEVASGRMTVILVGEELGF
ncbi:MAG: lactate utilization protein [Candidatus Omnitrophica bacterium]|nr:lactate utilization protein [Candidatus Omnitrophota bacterium]